MDWRRFCINSKKNGGQLNPEAVTATEERAAEIAPVLRMLYATVNIKDESRGGDGGASGDKNDSGACADGGFYPSGAPRATVVYLGNPDAPEGCGIIRVSVGEGSDPAGVLSELFIAETDKSGAPPRAVFIEDVGAFVCGCHIAESLAEARRILNAADADSKRVPNRSGADGRVPGCGGADDRIPNGGGAYGRIPGCGATDGRAPVKAPRGRLAGKIALITGGAQGFGRGIAEELAAQGAYVAVADLNFEGAKKCAAELSDSYGEGIAVAIRANVADEQSVAAMARETALSFGGLDLFISNAGILIAGALPDMTIENFNLVTSVNYAGYFLGVKHASAVMKRQRSVCARYTADIIEINSKSGLEGSNKNFAYAGSKFGGVGLTQSFALELVEHGIKVNAICPGNFLDGPLWSDPVKGLFKQYFDAGKVPGAKSTDDVRRYYESRVPMKRGCEVRDVARAIFYLVEQQYETGQALPVTGGQVMLS